MGKAYANRKQVKDRPESDFYATPKSLCRELLKLEPIPYGSEVYDPCEGEGAITDVLIEYCYQVSGDDIRTTGKDFLLSNEEHDYMMFNPPFSLFDEFVLQAQRLTRKKYIVLIKTNFFGAYKRYESGVWKHLESLYIFNRQVDYRSPTREDGHFNVGNLITGFAVFNKEWQGDYWETRIMDVQKYATLGGIK